MIDRLRCSVIGANSNTHLYISHEDYSWLLTWLLLKLKQLHRPAREFSWRGPATQTATMERQQEDWRQNPKRNINSSIVLRVALIVVTRKSKIAMQLLLEIQEAEMRKEGQNTEKLRKRNQDNWLRKTKCGG